MRTIASKISHRYTLVELLVAMAILVIMMGFLFQFVIGAQRIWNACEKTTSVFNSAEVTLNVMEQDLKSMRFSNDPGHTMPLYSYEKGNLVAFVFFSDFISNAYNASPPDDITKVGTYPVVFLYDKNAHKVYRYAIDQTNMSFRIGSSTNPITIPNIKVFYLYGIDPAINPDAFFAEFISVATNNNNLSALAGCDCLAEGVDDFKLDFSFPNGKKNGDAWYEGTDANAAKLKPLAAKISIKLHDPEADADPNAPAALTTDKINQTQRQFTKVVFL